MFEDRITALEKMQESRAKGFSTLLDGYETQHSEAMNLFRTQIYGYVDKQTADVLDKSSKLTNTSMNTHRNDFETMLVKLGENIQNAL